MLHVAMTGVRGAFGVYHQRAGVGARPWVPSLLASSGIYVAIAIAVVTFGSTAKKVARLAAVDVKFVEKIVSPPPPPAPAPVVDVKPQTCTVLDASDPDGVTVAGVTCAVIVP